VVRFMTTPVLPINSAQKVCAILRVLSADAPMRLTAIATAAALNKVTTFRILDTLCQEGFVCRAADGKRYRLGPEAFAMAGAMRQSANIVELARPSLITLASETGDTVLFGMRSGVEVVYLDREVGDFPIQANYLRVGSRRPLGVGAGGMAQLAWLPEREIAAFLPAITPRLKRYPRVTLAYIRGEIAAARARGAVVMLNLIVDRMGGIAVPVRTAQGDVLGVLSLVGLSDRLRDREAGLIAALRREAETVVRAAHVQPETTAVRPALARAAR
jgi:DNA-binding IclR family transcriptional regulator